VPIRWLRHWLLGAPLPSIAERHQRLPKTLALAVFSSDALSSVAYATEEILLVLILAGRVALDWSLPIALAILGLLAVVLPEFLPRAWWHHLLHNQSALLLKATLLYRRNVVVVDVPFQLPD
jgi:hypothetical protein